MVYVLACGKDFFTYEQIFSKLKETEPRLKPKKIMSDFEMAAMKAAKEVFPEAKTFGCFFHLCQCFYRQIQQNGLQTAYSSDATFAQYLRCLPALAFVPPEDVMKHFNALKKFVYFEEKLLGKTPVDVGVQNIFAYAEKNWVGYWKRNKFVAAKFPIELWNVYQLTLDGYPRTNNAVEAWHNAIKIFFGVHHPNIFNFIDGIKKEQDANEIIIAKMMSGIPTENKNKKQEQLAERLIAVVKTYEDPEKFQLKEFLFGVSSAIHLPISKQ